MPDNYAVLSGKYQRALVSIRELEQDCERYKAEAQKTVAKYTLLEKNMQELCVTIIKKKHEAPPKDGDSKNNSEKMWRSMPTIDLIRRAQESIEEYFPSLEKTINLLIKATEAKTKTIDSLKKELEEQKRVNESAIQEVSKKLEEGSSNKNLSKILNAGYGQKVDSINLDPSGDVELTSETDDGIEKTISEAIEVMSQDGDTIRRLQPGPKTRLNSFAKETIKKKAKECLLDNAKAIGEKAEKLTDVQKYLIQAFGDTGYSETTALVRETREKHINVPSESRVKQAMYELLKAKPEDRLIESAQCSVPGMPHFTLYKLSEMGRDVYTYLYEKNAAEAEMDIIRKNHSSLEHGYGIRQTAMLMMQSSYIGEDDEVIYLTRAKEHSVSLGENSSYIPDIVIKQKRNGKEKIFYIEYETGKCPDVAFFEKCNKMASFTRFINIIVPNNEAKNITVEKIKKWREKIQEGTYKIPTTIKFRISTYGDLKEGCNEIRFPWKMEREVSPTKS